jgi:glycosyltransferase involved in cell wall biosynthesis
LRIGIYIEHGIGNGVGGAELAMAHLASVWSQTHAVDLIHHRPPLTADRLALFSTEDYSRVNVRIVPREPEPPPSRNPFERYRAARAWHRHVSAGYDLFVNCTHWLPAFSHARVGALLVLFPFYVRPRDSDAIKRLAAWKRARHTLYHDFEWRRRLGTYQHHFAISEFSRAWTARRWGIDCEVVYPPVDIAFSAAPKEPLILSVGRFSTMAHTKKQLEMMRTFGQLSGAIGSEWTYASVGGLNARPENRAYFEEVRAAGRCHRTLVEANLDRASVRSLFQRARIFWHATGLDEDTGTHPELAEHFGMATAEAMAAGCVPVVIDKGGQREIVTHGESGFLWTSLAELKEYTLRLAHDGTLWHRMSAAARRRAARFARERFVDRFSRLFRRPSPSAAAASQAVRPRTEASAL